MNRSVKPCAAAVVMCFVLSGCASSRFSFDVAADMRMFTPPDHQDSRYFDGVAKAICEVGAGDFMVTPGDCDPPDRVKAVLVETMGAAYPWYAAVGNHELGKPEYMVWLRQYNAGGKTLPDVVNAGPPGAVETCYSVDHGNIHLVVLNEYFDGKVDNSKSGAMSDALLEWLANDLAATRQRHIFVAAHEPHVAIADMDNGRVRHRGESLDVNEASNHRFWSLLRRHNVCAYLCGHTHNTSVSRINGVWQIDAGHARGQGDKGAKSSFVKVRVDGAKVWCDVYRCEITGPAKYQLTWSERLR